MIIELAKTKGVDVDAIEEARDTYDPRQALIALIAPRTISEDIRAALSKYGQITPMPQLHHHIMPPAAVPP